MFANDKLVIFKINQCLLDLSNKNKEAFGVIVDDVATRHLGKDSKPWSRVYILEMTLSPSILMGGSVILQ